MTLGSWGNEGVPRLGDHPPQAPRRLCLLRVFGCGVSERAGQLPSLRLVGAHGIVGFTQATCKSPADVLKFVRFQGGKKSRFPVFLKTIADSALSCRVRFQTWVTRGHSLPEGSVTPCGGVSLGEGRGQR